MKIKILFFTILLSHSLQAKECEAPSEMVVSNAMNMRPIAAGFIKKITAIEKLLGRDFTLGIIERRGTDLSDFQLLNVVDDQKRPTSFQNFLDLITYDLHSGDDGLNQKKAVFYGDIVKRFDKRKLLYSHVGFILKNHPKVNPETKEEGDWHLVHLLDPCDRKGGPRLRDQTLDQFFADKLSDYTYKIVVPNPALQEKLEKLILGGDYSRNSLLLTDFYNAATLWSQDKDGNSNSWPLEMIAAAQKEIGEVTTRAQAIEILKQTGYQPSVVLGNSTSHAATLGWIGNMFRVDFKDQPWAADYNIGQVVTALSIEDYLKTLGQLAAEYEHKISFLTIPQE